MRSKSRHGLSQLPDQKALIRAHTVIVKDNYRFKAVNAKRRKQPSSRVKQALHELSDHIAFALMSMLKECSSVWPSHTPLRAFPFVFQTTSARVCKQDQGEQERTAQMKNILLWNPHRDQRHTSINVRQNSLMSLFLLTGIGREKNSDKKT